MPSMFAIGDAVIANPIIATFAAFGSFAMLLLVDFSRHDPRPGAGPELAGGRLRGADLPRHARLALDRGWRRWRWRSSASPSCSRASSARCWPAPPPRCCWPSSCRCRCPGRSPRSRTGCSAGGCRGPSRCWRSRCCGPRRRAIRSAAAAIAACRALAERLRAEIAWVTGERHAATPTAARRRRRRRPTRPIEALQKTFFATPFRPTGLTTAARAVVRLVDELRWLNTIVLHSTPRRHPPARQPGRLHGQAARRRGAGGGGRAA